MADTSPLVDTYGLFIDGSWVEPDAGRYEVINPATERSITSAPDASVGQVQDAISAARSILSRRCSSAAAVASSRRDRAA